MFKLIVKYSIYTMILSALATCNSAVADNYPPDPTSNTEWSLYTTETSVSEIEYRFNYARGRENSQLGTSIPDMELPSQSVWDSMSDAEKGLWLINRERIDRGVDPLHGLEDNVMSVSEYYANYLMDNDLWSHTADGRTPWQRLADNPAIGACYDFLAIAENLAYFVSTGAGVVLPVERAVHNWMYDDYDPGNNLYWGHRHTILWYPYNDNSGPSGKEGFLGFSRVHGEYFGYQESDVLVMNIFDPCSTWVYPVEPIPGDLNGDDELNLEDAVLALMILSGNTVSAGIALDNDVDGDGKVGLGDAIYIIEKVAGLRD